MKRRSFLRQTGAAAGMVTLLPMQGFASMFSLRPMRVALPETQLHVRHGQFSPLSEIRIEGLPELTGFRKDVLFQNGFEASPEDLVSFRFNWGKKEFGITVLEGTAHVSCDGNTSPIPVGSGQTGMHSVAEGPDIHLETFSGDGHRTFSFPSKAMVIPVIPPIAVDGRIISDEDAMVIPAGASFQLKGWKGTSYLILC